MQLALKIEVGSYRGTREGVPQLLEVLTRHAAKASFFFALGADRSGRAVFGKNPRVGLFEHYGIKALLYGTLLPSPHIGSSCRDILLRVRDAGFEVGCLENMDWREHVATQSAAWTRREMQLTVAQFTEVFGEAPKAHAASGWQLNRDALRLTQHLGFEYASDTRGGCPFIPTWDAEIINCPQLPTTLPTLDELIGRDGITVDNVAERLLEMTRNSSANGHIFTLRAELEGRKWLPVFEQLLAGWKVQGYELVALRQYLQDLQDTLPRHGVRMGELNGRKGKLAIQL